MLSQKEQDFINRICDLKDDNDRLSLEIYDKDIELRRLTEMLIQAKLNGYDFTVEEIGIIDSCEEEYCD